MARGQSIDAIEQRIVPIPRAWLRTAPQFPDVMLVVARQYLLDRLPLDDAMELGLRVSKGQYNYEPEDFGMFGSVRNRPPYFTIHAKDYPSAVRVQESIEEIDGLGMEPWAWVERGKRKRVMGRGIHVYPVPFDYREAMLERMNELYWPAKERYDAERPPKKRRSND